MSKVTIKLKKLHSAQQQILDESKRFNVLKCGRRFGKTELSKELAIQPLLDGMPVGYWCPTYKDLDDVWKDICRTLKDVIVYKNETLKQIRLITGGILDMWSMEDPDSGRGRKYKRAIIDEGEKAKKLEEAWKGTIRATLTDYKGDAWFLSTPKFGETFFKTLSRYKSNPKFSHEWMSWVFTTYDNPFMDPTEIDAAKATLDEIYFRCEYMAEDVDFDMSRWAFSFSRDKHVGRCQVNYEHELWEVYDFNKNPICCTLIQHYDDTIWIPKCYKLPNSDIYKLCDNIWADHGIHNPLFLVTGDATGRARSALAKDNKNYYDVIKLKHNLSDGQMRQPTTNPKLEENQVLVNSLLSNYQWCIDEENAAAVIYDMENVKMLADGSIDKGDRNDPAKQADALDTVRYFCNTELAWFIKIYS